LIAYLPDRGPLREILDQHASKNFYPIMAFALVSAYELLGGLEAEEGGPEKRRYYRLKLPLPEPSHFTKLIQEGTEFRNLLWWASRGRPGWALPLWDNWRPSLQSWRAKRLEDLTYYVNEDIDGQAIEWAQITSRIPETSREILKQLIICCSPIPKTDLPLEDKDLEEAMDKLGDLHLIFTSPELSPVDEVVSSLVKELHSLSQREEFQKYFNDTSFDDNLIRRYLRRILEGTSKDGKVAFGGWKQPEAFARASMAPILTLLHDLILDFEATKEGNVCVEFLNALLDDLGIWQNKINTPRIIDYFPETRRVFKDVYKLDDANYVQPSFKLISLAFPSRVISPMISLHEITETSRTINAQRERLVEKIQRGEANFPQINFEHQNLTLNFFILPSSDLLPNFQQLVFPPSERNNYLDGKRIFVILDCSDQEISLTFDYSQNKDLEILEKYLKKVQIRRLEERRLRDFLVSLSYNKVFHPKIQTLSDDLQELIESLLQRAIIIDRNTERSLRYFKGLLIEKLNRFCELIIREYRENMEKFFSIKGIPVTQIRRAEGTLGRPRTIETILCALDAFYNRKQVTQVLWDLRSLEHLRSLVTGYQKFVNGFGSKDDRDLTDYQEALLTYLEQHGAFNDLLIRILPSFAYEFEEEVWDEMNFADVIVGESTPLDLIWGEYVREKEIAGWVLKALNIYYLLQKNKTRLQGKVAELKGEIKELQEDFEYLNERVSRFNERLESLGLYNDDFLSNDIVRRFQYEFKKGERILEDSSLFGSLLVSYRFLKEAKDKAQDKKDRYSDTLTAWERKFRDIFSLDGDLNRFRSQVEEAFINNPVLKKDVLGDPKDLYLQKIEQPLKSAAKDIIGSLTPPYSLDTDIPSVNLQQFNDCYDTVQSEVDEIVRHAQMVDEIIEDFKAFRNKLFDVDQIFKGASK